MQINLLIRINIYGAYFLPQQLHSLSVDEIPCLIKDISNDTKIYLLYCCNDTV